MYINTLSRLDLFLFHLPVLSNTSYMNDYLHIHFPNDNWWSCHIIPVCFYCKIIIIDVISITSLSSHHHHHCRHHHHHHHHQLYVIIINYSWPIIIIIFVALYTLVAGQGGKSSPPAYTTALETALRTEIFTGYSHLQRPMKQVQVNIELTLLTVNDLVSIK